MKTKSILPCLCMALLAVAAVAEKIAVRESRWTVALVDIRFWQDQDKNLHPDASFTFPRVELAPGGTFDVSSRPFVVGACSREGLSRYMSIGRHLAP